MPNPSARTGRHQLSTSVAVTVGILLAIPIIAIVWVPFYARKGPELWGFPFFYWYQMVWVIACGLFTGAAYILVERDRKRSKS